MAIDKETLLATAYGGQGIVAGSPIPPGMPGHQPDIGLPYDVEAAKAELATALTELGYSDVSEVPVLSFGFNTEAGHDVPAAFMQEQWRTNLGVESELKGVTFDQFVVERPQLVYSIARNAWGAGLPAPGQHPAGPVPQPEWQQRRGVQQPRVRQADRGGRREARHRRGHPAVQPGTGDPR